MQNVFDEKGNIKKIVLIIISVIIILILAGLIILTIESDKLFSNVEIVSEVYSEEEEREEIDLAFAEWEVQKKDNLKNQTFSTYMQERFEEKSIFVCEEIDERTVKLIGTGKNTYEIEENGTIRKNDSAILLSKDVIVLVPEQMETIETQLVKIKKIELVFESSDPDTITVTGDGVLTVTEEYKGTEATIFVSCAGCRSVCKVYVADQKNFTYTNFVDGSASISGLSNLAKAKMENKLTKFAVPDTVVIDEYKYTIVSISPNAFRNEDLSENRNFDLYNIPNEVTQIGAQAFYKCTSLSLTSLPDGITTIETNAFNSCTNLALTSLPSKLTSVGHSAFLGCEKLSLSSLPKELTNIEDQAFMGVTNLSATELPEGLTVISNSAFCDCTSLSLTSLPSGITSIGLQGFDGCTNVRLTELPSGVTSIGESAFRGTGISLTNLPSELTDIGKYAFQNCESIKTITIPANVSNIGECPFQGCTSLTTINVDEENSNYASKDGVLFDKEITHLINYPNGSNLDTYTVPDSVKTIGQEAFKGSKTLKKVVILNTIENIGSMALAECGSLETVYYTGTEEEWNNITKANDAVPNRLKIVYNYNPS